MSKKNKNKTKKVSIKKEKYAKFHKEKSGTMDITMPDLGEALMKQKREDEERINKFLKFNRNPPAKELKEKRLKRQ